MNAVRASVFSLFFMLTAAAQGASPNSPSSPAPSEAMLTEESAKAEILQVISLGIHDGKNVEGRPCKIAVTDEDSLFSLVVEDPKASDDEGLTLDQKAKARIPSVRLKKTASAVQLASSEDVAQGESGKFVTMNRQIRLSSENGKVTVTAVRESLNSGHRAQCTVSLK
jgi:hypothetical protein